LTAAFAPSSNPYLFAPTGIGALVSGGDNPNFSGFKKYWNSKTSTTSIAPLLKVKSDGRFLDINYELAENFPSAAELQQNPEAGKGKWVPKLDGFGGGAIPAQTLLTISIANETALEPITLPSNAHLSSISPTGTFTNGYSGGIPSYVNTFTNSDILQSRPVIFDKSGVRISVSSGEQALDPQTGKRIVSTNSTTGQVSAQTNTLNVNQFTLSGRPFALNDMIGNSTSKVNVRLKDSVTYSELKSVETKDSSNSTGGTSSPSDQCTQGEGDSCLDIQETLDFVDVSSSSWTNSVCSESDSSKCSITGQGSGVVAETEYFWVNPGYFQNLEYSSSNGYSFATDYEDASGNVRVPTWNDVTGLTQPAIVNSTSKYDDGLSIIRGETNGLPGMPIATTAEEWVLVNNSDVAHPFHRHSNPFFVEEVGQLSYECFGGNDNCDASAGGTGRGEWVIRAKTRTGEYDPIPETAPTSVTKLDGQSLIPDFTGNWWDTLIIPPHGYVKVKYWINVPQQTSSETVLDNQNRQGIWVYHCHILRHEDRGMMMPVITQKLYKEHLPETKK
jgi:hypothetical protein